MARGGARPGAGRPRKGAAVPAAKAPAAKKKPIAKAAAATAPPTAPTADLTTEPLDFLLSVMRDPREDKRLRLQAASLAAPYVHAKVAVGGKRAAAQSAAGKTANTSRFGPGAPPLRVVGSK